MDASQSTWNLAWNLMYDTESGSKRAATPKPGPRAESATWVVSNRLYLFGGFGTGGAKGNGRPRGYLNDVWYYDLDTKKWNLEAGSTTPVVSATAFKREDEDSENGVIVPIASLPAMSGSAAYLRTEPAWLPTTVVLVGGQRYGWLTNATYFLDLSTGAYNASVLYSTSPPKERVGGLLYPSAADPSFALYYGGFTASNPLLDLNLLDTVSGTWSYICDSSFCANNPHIPWCVACLAALPTKAYTGGLRYASFFSVNSTNLPSQVTYGGQTFSPTDTHWTMANWTVISGSELEYPNIPEHYCPQPNPNPQVPWSFQCVVDTWEASNLCPSCPIELTLSAGEPIRISGNWTPNAVYITFQQGSLLNISGTFSMLNMMADLDMAQSDFDELARNSVSRVTLFESAQIDSLDVALPPNFSTSMLSKSFVSGCTMRTVDSHPTWTTPVTSNSSSGTGRESLGVAIQWKTANIPDCTTNAPTSKKSANLAIIIPVSAAGGVVLIVGVALVAYFASPRLRSMFSSSAKSSTPSTYAADPDRRHTDPSDDERSQPRKSSTSSSSKAATTSTVSAGSNKLDVPASTLYNPHKSAVSFHDTTGVQLQRRSTNATNDYIASTPRSDLDYESGLGSLDTSVQDDYVTHDDSFISTLAGL